MNTQVTQLAREVAAMTGARLPDVMEEDSPTLRADALLADDESFYLVGLIGGKEVGKSAIVNALVGEPITASTAFGPGTDHVVAYVHESQADDVRELLEREAPQRHRIVTHAIERLRRQVLLDLPDIDSQHGDHVELTRRMLRHMLYPVWVQSVEKYADQQPQKLLAAVASGNDPANFLFCLNKADQLSGANSGAELRDDYAARIARVLKLSQSPRVFLISAINSDAFDFASLRQILSQEKATNQVRQSTQLAGRRQERSVLAWLDTQRLPERALRLKRLEDQAVELTTARLAAPLLEMAVPRILDDPAHRAAMADEVMAARVARWPVVNMLDTLLTPITSIWRQNVSAGRSIDSLVATMVDGEGRSLSASIQATFALLQQTSPTAGELLSQQKLWEQMPADDSASTLRRSLVSALERQRAAAIERLARRGFLMPLVRWLLTIGAIIWFPLGQPVAEMVLSGSIIDSIRQALFIAVQLLSAAALLKSAGFLLIWMLSLWLILRWDTQRRVNKLLLRWRNPGDTDASINLAAAIVAWCDELIEPIRIAREREESLARRAADLTQKLSAQAA